MNSLFTCGAFAGFGPSRVLPPDHAPETGQVRGRKRLRQRVRDHAPRRPGCYGMLDPRGELIYVGKAKCLRTRLMSYFRENSRDAKAGRIIDQTRGLAWEISPHEFAALIRELELIRRFRPRFNVLGVPGRRRYSYVCVGRAPAPYAYVTPNPTGREIACFGPLVGARQAGDGVRRLNDLFGLRDCPQRQPMAFADQRELFPVVRSPGCLRHEIGTCLGPCVGGCSRAKYAGNVRAARAFLDGDDLRPLERVEAEMRAAAAGFQFERAAALRDKLADLRWLADRLTWLRHARNEHSFVYPLEGGDGRTVWYLIRRGQVHAAAFEPKTAAARRALARKIEEVLGKGDGAGTALPVTEVDSVLLVSGWFRKRPEERAKTLTTEQALARMKDEG